MGTTFRITLYADDEPAAVRAAAAAFARIDRLEDVATDYRRDSEARLLGAVALEQPAVVSRDLARVLRAADHAVSVSGGAFDPTAGALTHRWRRALRQGVWPDAAVWSPAAARVGWVDLVQLEETDAGLAVTLARPGMRLDFGGVAKGVAVDEALVALESNGVLHALVDGGGDLACRRPPPGADGWRVEVRPFGAASGPPLRFLLKSGAIATSGDAFQSAALDGEPLPGVAPGLRYGHVLDPRTARPLEVPRAAVMTAATAAEADALATALMVLEEPPQHAPPPMRRGLFFRGTDAAPCVGDLFPQDGVSLAR